MAKSAIEWTEYVWNPMTGCTPCSRGCKHCYAKKMAERLRLMGLSKYRNGFTPTFHPGELLRPYLEKTPRVWFVDSMSDLFHLEFSHAQIAAVFAMMGLCSWHKFIVLTKQALRMERWFERVGLILSDFDRWKWFHDALSERLGEAATTTNISTCEAIVEQFKVEHARLPFANVALGVTVENQDNIERIHSLRVIPAACRLVSLEPLVGPVFIAPHIGSLPDLDDGSPGLSLDWVILGGESGSRSAQMLHPNWVRSVRDECIANRVPFFFKQWGDWAPYSDESKYTHGGEENARNEQEWMRDDGVSGSCWIYDDDGSWSNWCGHPGEDMSRVCVFNHWGKKRAGRMLDGRIHNELPEFFGHG